MTGPTAGPIRVLCVDDEPGLAALVAESLSRASDRITAESATSVDAALDRLSPDVDCVVSDYELPDTDGVEFLREVRETRPDLPFVLFTGEGSESVAAEAVSAGVTDYVPKGSGDGGYALLADRVEDAVERERARRREAEHRRVGTVVREIDRALVEARDHDEVDRRVCAILADADPYRLAWVGTVDEGSNRVVPHAVAGDERGYLDDVTIAVDDSPLGGGPAGTAVREERVAVSQDLAADERFAPWADDAAARGYRAAAVVPLVHDGDRYGVLAVYADRTGAFSERERALLSELGDTVAHAHRRIDVQRDHDRAYETQFRELFADAPVSFVATRATEDGPVIDHCNRLFAESLGYEPGDLDGEPLATVYDAESAALLSGGGYERALAGEFVREHRTLVARDGSTVETLLRAAPRRAPDGDIVGTHALYVDVTNDTHLQALERQNERLDRFTSVVSHDLRNPLHVAEGRLSLARADLDGENEHLAAADRALDRMDALIEDLLTLAREGERVDETTTVDLAALATDCWTVDVVDTDRATLDVETSARVRADRSRLRQLLGNLLANAVEHGSTDGRGEPRPDVRVTVGDLDDGFYVADDGPGLAPADRERVFESGHSTSDDGTGVGLSIVRETATAHGWRVRATESATGGARFEVRGVDRAARVD